MNNLDRQYTELLQDILDNGVKKTDRTGTGTISVFGRQIRHKMSEGFPLLTTKKMAWKTMVTELLWFLRGDTNIKYLVDNGCHIWDGDAYKNYVTKIQSDYSTYNPKYKDGFDCNYKSVLGTVLEDIGSKYSLYAEPFTMDEFINKIKTDDEFAKRWGELGPIYGAQWRRWSKNKMYLSTDGSYENIYDEADQTVIDQISILINELKTNPDSRRLMVNTWNVGELDQMVLPPCHYGFQVYTRELSLEERFKLAKYDWPPKGLPNIGISMLEEKNIPKRAISLMWNQRSVDTFLGLPFNIASYGLLLELIANEVNMVPDELIGNLGDTHLYLNHIEQSREQIGRDLTDEERYDIWFNNNYETGMERNFNPNNLPSFDNDYYEPTPKRTREPFKLPTVHIRDGIYSFMPDDIILENYQSHPSIKAPLSN